MTQLETPTSQESLVSTTRAAHAKAIEIGKYAIEMTTASGSGHPSTGLAIAHIIVELMYRQMRYDPRDPWNPGSDRLVLSIGHGVPIVYAAYADLGGTVGKDPDHGQPLTVADLGDLRELTSVLDGHPNPAEGFPFFDAATGSLGQGLSAGAGLALAARLDGIDKRIYVVAGDGESREGQVWEAADFIVDHKLNNVCLIVSCNGHGQAAPVSTQQSSDAIAAKLNAFGWATIEADGHDPDELSAAFDKAKQATRPTAIVARTIKGWGVDFMQRENYHGKPVPKAQLAQAFAELDATGEKLSAKPDGIMQPAMPKQVEPSEAVATIQLPPFDAALKRAGFGGALESKKLATRKAYGAALLALGDADHRIVALDGDVKNSTFSLVFGDKYPDRFFECKIAEQNMITVSAGLAATGKIPFASSFAKFLARGADQIDMASITRANIKLVGSHAGVSLAADGPSQMSLSDMAYFRSMTQVEVAAGQRACYLFHPCDAVSAYRCCELMANITGMCYLRTHRPDAPFTYPFDEQFTPFGCKQLREGKHLTIASSGYMVHTALEAAKRLGEQGITCNVFDAYTFPLDATPILDAARAGGSVILTVEDNYLGGLHGELAEAAAQDGGVRVFGMNVVRVPKSARTAEDVFTHVGVGLEQVVQKAVEVASR